MNTHRSFKGLAAALLAAGLCGASVAQAASVSYYLDQSNTTPPLDDGVNYMIVTIDDNSPSSTLGYDNLITFTVSAIPGVFDEGTNFGIQSFGFNNPMGTLTINDFVGLPTGWDVFTNRNQNGFGNFDFVVSTQGATRQDPLVFSIDVHGDNIYTSYFGGSSGTAPEQGNAYFAAHVTDFDAGYWTGTEWVESAFFGGGDGGEGGSPPNMVPVPAAVWLFGSGLLGLVGIARRKRAA